MTEKNKKKEKAKEKRVTWNFNPITRVIKNKKAYDRNRDRKDKRFVDDMFDEVRES